MARTERLVETRDLKTTYLSGILAKSPNLPTFYRYDRDLDTAFLLFVDSQQETITHLAEDDVALLVDPENLEVVGLTIEAFEKRFLGPRGERLWRLSETGLAGVHIAFRFELEAAVPGWDRKALEVKTTAAQQREVDVRVTA